MTERVCGFCQGRPVGNAATWVDGKPRPAAPCPRCGVVTPYSETETVLIPRWLWEDALELAGAATFSAPNAAKYRRLVAAASKLAPPIEEDE